jgi:hypothetical protein
MSAVHGHLNGLTYMQALHVYDIFNRTDFELVIITPFVRPLRKSIQMLYALFNDIELVDHELA